MGYIAIREMDTQIMKTIANKASHHDHSKTMILK